MKLCYLVNQYPKVSHSFIRREILELERQGAEVLRAALRGWEQAVVDPLDVAEQGRTHYVLKRGIPFVLASACWHALRSPWRFLRAVSDIRALRRTSDKSLVRHLICLAEASVIAGWIGEAGVTHIHAHFGTNSADVALLASRLSGVPFSFTVHGPEEFDHPEGLGLRYKMQRAARTIAISSYGRSQLYRWATLDNWNRIEVVHCGLDELFSEEPDSGTPESRTFVCVGRLCEQKGQILLLDALRIVIDAGHSCRLVLAGDGEMRPQIEKHAHALGLGGHIVITGWIAAEQVKQEILSARALVLPSFAEGLPVVLMEALALSRPVISTYVAGIPELVKDGECGWLVPAGDPRSLAAAMIECLQSNGTRLADMGRNGRQRALERHDIRTAAAMLLRIFGSSGT